MANFTVTSAQLMSKAEELKSLNGRFRSAINDLETQEGALRGMWEGEANNAFHNAFQSDKIQLTNFYNAIEMYVVRLNEIARRYQQAEASNTEIATTRKYN